MSSSPDPSSNELPGAGRAESTGAQTEKERLGTSGERALKRARLVLFLFIGTLTVCLVLGALLTGPRAAHAAGGAAASSTVFFENGDSGALFEAPPISSSLSLEGDREGLRSTLRQTFVNPASRALPGIYIIRLARNAELQSIRVLLDGEVRMIESLSDHRLSSLYTRASSNGRLAELLPPASNLVHAIALPSLAPGQTITVEVRFVEPE